MRKKLYEQTKKERKIEEQSWNDWFSKFTKRIIKKEKSNTECDGGFVYLVECGGYFKIGRAVNTKRRIADMQGGNPFQINLICYSFFRDNVYTERMLHKSCFTERVVSGKNREWFVLNDFFLKQVVEMIMIGSQSHSIVNPINFVSNLEPRRRYSKKVSIHILSNASTASTAEQRNL